MSTASLAGMGRIMSATREAEAGASVTFISSRSQDYTRHKQNKTRKKREKSRTICVPDLLPSEAWAPETTAGRKPSLDVAFHI